MSPIDTPDRHQNRRTYLKAIGVGGAGLIAGCTGGGNGGSGDDGGSGGSGGSGDDGGSGGSGGSGDDGGSGGSSGGSGDDDFPDRSIELIVTYGTGGGYDIIARLVAPFLSDELGVDVQVVNVEGAGGRIGLEQAYSADPDGYTMVLANAHAAAITQIEEGEVNYDIADFTWYGQFTEDVRGIGIAQHTGSETWEDYLEAQQNAELTWYSAGPGLMHVGVPILLGEISGLWSADDVTADIVHYDGRGEAYQGIVSGDVDAMSGSYHSVLPYTTAEDGELNMIISLNMGDESPEHEDTPDCETLETAGVDNAEEIISIVTGRRPFGAPPDVPEERAQILSDAVGSVLQSDEFQAAAEEAGQTINYLDPGETEEAIGGLQETWESNPDLLDAIYYE